MRNADNLSPYRAVVKKSGELTFLDPSRPARPVRGELFYIYFKAGEGGGTQIFQNSESLLKILGTKSVA